MEAHEVKRLAVVVAFLVLAWALPAAASTPSRVRFLQAVNARRPCSPLVATGHRLLSDARAHSREMADAGYIFHSDLALGRWDRVGEVVGVAISWQRLVDLLYNSPEHRRILRDCRYNFMAVGFHREDGTAWLTSRLYG
jgi:uncharacterized protein YkwD